MCIDMAIIGSEPIRIHTIAATGVHLSIFLRLRHQRPLVAATAARYRPVSTELTDCPPFQSPCGGDQGSARRGVMAAPTQKRSQTAMNRWPVCEVRKGRLNDRLGPRFSLWRGNCFVGFNVRRVNESNCRMRVIAAEGRA